MLVQRTHGGCGPICMDCLRWLAYMFLLAVLSEKEDMIGYIYIYVIFMIQKFIWRKSVLSFNNSPMKKIS